MMKLKSPYFIEPQPPCYDFNRELQAPGLSKNFPNGVVGIRVDDDFWAVACLPWEYKNHSIENLVALCWPQIDSKECSFLPDSEHSKLDTA